MLFTGSHEATLDLKNRVSIPAPIRTGMDPEVDGTDFYVVPGRQDAMYATLYLYPNKYFERISEERYRAQQSGEAQEDFELVYFAHATRLEVDKQGRILLPQWAIDRARLDRHLMLSGARDRLVIWNRDEFKKYMEYYYAKQAELKKQAAAPHNGNGSAGS